jgi:hypothetical protein
MHLLGAAECVVTSCVFVNMYHLLWNAENEERKCAFDNFRPLQYAEPTIRWLPLSNCLQVKESLHSLSFFTNKIRVLTALARLVLHDSADCVLVPLIVLHSTSSFRPARFPKAT